MPRFKESPKNPVQRSQVKKQSNKNIYTETGATGTQFFSGYLYNEEYQSDLNGSKGLAVYDKMRRGDGQVKGILQAIKMPIIQSKWYIEPASQDTQDKEIADIVSSNLFSGMYDTWSDFVRQCLTYLEFGFSMFEKVFEYRDGLILLSKLSMRIQKSLNKWLLNKEGNFGGFQQYAQTADGKFQYIDIPSEKLALFINEQEGNNFEGISVLRAAYGHWYIKQELYKIDAIGHDRFASGIPWAQEPQAVNAEDRKRVATILKEIYSRERSYMVIPYGWEKGIFERTGSNDSILKSIQHHNEEIAKITLAQFINLGTTASGSRSLGESFEELFLLGLNGIADYVCETVNNEVIKQLVDLNWNVKEYPKLKHQKIVLSVYKYLDSIGRAYQTTLLTKGLDIENKVREYMEFPKLAELPTPEIKVEKDVQDDNQNQDVVQKFSDTKYRRQLTEAEKNCVDLDNIKKLFDDSTEKTAKEIDKVRKQQVEFLSGALLTTKPEDIKMPYVGKLADRIYTEMKSTFKKSRDSVRNELKGQRKDKKLADVIDTIDYDETDEIETMGYLKSKSEADATRFSNALLSAGLFYLYHSTLKDKTKDNLKKELYTKLLESNKKDIESISKGAMAEAVQTGRNYEAENQKANIETAIYSAILDENNCEICAEKDGVEHEIDDPTYFAPNPQECLGHDRCRCINIYVLKDDK